ncbi:MAG TPA: hypothetical protein PK451_09840, partial [Ruminococcus bicirculans (ex Wegman et al. 2014)]|nr:hypothetical protein [Ruminococcus bicirculans (ex Wegman et al. 2014)]
RFEIVPMPDGSLTDEAYEDRYTYDLAQNRYKPVLCKKTDEGMLRLFEIPFRTFDCEDFRFVFIAMHAVATLYAPKLVKIRIQKSFQRMQTLRIRILTSFVMRSTAKTARIILQMW